MKSVASKSYINNPNENLLGNSTSQQKNYIPPTRARVISQSAPRLNDSEIITRLKKIVQKNIAYQGGLSEISHRNLTDALDKQPILPTGKAEKYYNKLQRAVKNANSSMKNLEEHLVGDFCPEYNPQKYKAAMEVLKQAINAQYKLQRALKIYGKTVTDMSRCCTQRAEDCERRISEMLNVVSQAHIPNPRRNHLDLTKNIAASMNEVTTDMHGTPQALQEMYAEANALFYELDMLEQQNSGTDKYKVLDKKIQKLQAKLTSLYIPKTSHYRATISYDAVLLDGFNSSLTSARERCKAIVNPNIKTVQKNAIEEIIQPTIDALTVINYYIQDLPITQKKIVESIMAYTITIKSSLHAELSQPDNLRNLNQIYISIQEMSARIEEWSSEIKLCVHEKIFKQITNCIKASMYGKTGYEFFSSGADELAELVAKNDVTSASGTGTYLAHAFYNSPGIDALTECYVRGIPSQYIEKESSEKKLLDSTTLGEGQVNEVTLCVYKAPHGQPLIEKVFKPEYAGRHRMRYMISDFFDGNDFSEVLVRKNIASSEVAKYLGCPNIVSSATAGTYKNKFGLFMSKAPGKTPCDLLSPNNYNECDLVKAIRTSIAHGNFKIMKASLRRELSNLEWADVLSGQIDRHDQNYLVDINGMTGAVTVTGIDNDMSFSTAMTGVGIISVNNMNISPEKKAKLEPYFMRNSRGELYLDDDNSPVINMRMIDNIGQDVIYKETGLNQKIIPDFIDQKTYAALMSIDETNYAETLEKLLPPENVQASLKRLKAAKQHANELCRKNLAINDWQAPIVEDYYNEVIMKYESDMNHGINYPNHGTLELPFYVRDFHYIIFNYNFFSN